MTEDKPLPFRCGEDFASSWLEDELEIVTPFYYSPGYFNCRPLRGRKTNLKVPVQHLLGPGANDENLAMVQHVLGRVLSASHRALLSRWDGCTLFAQTDGSEPTGLHLFSGAELIAAHQQASHVNPGQAPLSVLIIGELLGSGHFVALDDSIPSGGESPVVALSDAKRRNHLVELSIVATTLTELLLQLMEAPVILLERMGGVRYHVDGKVYIPLSYRMG